MVLDHHSSMAIYKQIAQKIIEEIQLARLPPSTAMPGSRELANSLKVNRKTVVLAYDELIAQGWLTSQNRRGTFVSAKLLHLIAPKPKQVQMASVILSPNSAKAYAKATTTEDRPLFEDIIDFTDGGPDTRLIPLEALARAFRHALVVSGRANRLGYDSPKGMLPLRKAIATMLNMERGLHINDESVCLVRGSQMGLYLCARVLLKAHDCVVMESLSYPPARNVFKTCGAQVLSVGLDDEGMLVDELEQLCQQHPVRAVYLTPHHHFPTTVTLSESRKLKLIQLAELYQFYIIEDDYDHEFHYAHYPVFPIASTNQHGRVIYIGSLSKVLAPALRLAYVVANEEIIEKFAIHIMCIDRQGNSVTELAIAELMNKGELMRHIRRTAKIYQERRDVLHLLIRDALGEYVDYDLPTGGLAFWLKLKGTLNVDDLVKAALNEKVRIMSGTLFADVSDQPAAIRLGFGSLNPIEMNEGIKRLKRAFKEAYAIIPNAKKSA